MRTNKDDRPVNLTDKYPSCRNIWILQCSHKKRNKQTTIHFRYTWMLQCSFSKKNNKQTHTEIRELGNYNLGRGYASLMTYLVKTLDRNFERAISRFELWPGPGAGSCRGSQGDDVLVFGLWMWSSPQHKMTKPHLQIRLMIRMNIKNTEQEKHTKDCKKC